jgi:TolB-like protein
MEDHDKPESRHPSGGVLERIKRRAVVQWTLAYVAAAWALLEIVDFASTQFLWSPSVPRSAAILAVAGFFVTIVLAWYHGDKGRQRMGGTELLILAGLFSIAGVLLSRFGPAPDVDRVPPLQTSPGDVPRVAVLPCTNQSPDPEDSYRATGLHDEILLKLQKISSLESIGRTSVLRYADAAPSTAEIASELSVDFIGECTVQRAEPRIRVIFQLLDARGVQVWADDYNQDLTLSNVLDIQVEIATQVASAIGAAVTPQELDRITRPPTLDLTAYELYQAGRARWMTRWGPSMREAIELYQAAIDRDPTFGLAHAGLAQAHMLMPMFSDEPVHPSFAQAKASATRALQLNPDLAEAHAALGYIAFAYDWSWPRAEQHFQRAIALNPDDAETRGWYSDLLYVLSRYQEASAQAARGVALDPRSWSATRSALVATEWQNFEDPERLLRDFLESNPDHFPAEFGLVVMLLLAGRYDDAGEAAESLWQAYGFEHGDSIRALYRSVGDPASWDRARRLVDLFQEQVPDPDARAMTGLFHMVMGANDEAVDDARFLVDARSYHATQLGGWTPLLDDPRFLALLDEVGLPRPESEGADPAP